MFPNRAIHVTILLVGVFSSTFLRADDPPPKAEKLDLAAWNAVQETLKKQVSVDFRETPLKDAAAKLGEQLQLSITVDEKSLVAAAIAVDSPVTLQLTNAPGRSVLRRMLLNAGLVYCIQKNAVVITTFDFADANLDVWTEDVSDLVAMNLDIDFKELSRFLQEIVMPTTWKTVGGPGSVKLDDVRGMRGLTFSQSFDVHERIDDFFSRYRKLCRIAQQRKQTAEMVEAIAKGKMSAKDFVPPSPPYSTLLEPLPAEMAIQKALNKAISIDFDNAQLEDVARYLSKQMQIPVVLDSKAYPELNLAPDTPVTKKLTGITAKSVLELLLPVIGLSYMIYDDTLLITSPDFVECTLSTHYFEVTDLLLPNDTTRESENVDILIELISFVIKPTAWDCVGGPGMMESLYIADSRFLMVSQTQDTQQEVLDLLTSLRTLQHPVQAIAPNVPSGSREKQADEKSGSLSSAQAGGKLLSDRPHEAFRQALEKPVTLKFKDAPLSEIAKHLEKLIKFQVMLDDKALADLGISGDTSFSIDVQNVKLKEALDLLLTEPELGWMIRDDVLMITSKDMVDNTLETRIFDVYDLPAFRRTDGRTMPDYEQLKIAIESIEKDTWDTVGGSGSVEPYDSGGIQALVVTQTWAVQEQILQLLENTRKLRKWPLSKEEIDKLPPAPPLKRRVPFFLPQNASGMGLF